MVLTISGIEKDLPYLLRLVKSKLTKEKEIAINMLQRYRWITIDKDVECACATVDSSFSIIESRIGFIYVVQGIAVLYSIRDNLAKNVDHITFSDIGFIEIKIPKDHHYIVKKHTYKKVLTEYAYTLELENLVKIIEKHNSDLALLDGSFISFVMSRKSGDVGAYIDSVRGVHSLEEIERLKLQYLEKLLKHRYTVFLAKSSNAGFYTQGLYPDMYILELARLYRIEPYSNPGFLEPLTLDVKSTLSKFIRGYSIPTNEFTITYTRLYHGAPVYQLSFPYKLSEEDLKSICMCLKKWSPSGYPIPLEYAHRFSKLPRKKLLNSMIMLGIPIASGRELIEIS